VNTYTFGNVLFWTFGKFIVPSNCFSLLRLWMWTQKVYSRVSLFCFNNFLDFILVYKVVHKRRKSSPGLSQDETKEMKKENVEARQRQKWRKNYLKNLIRAGLKLETVSILLYLYAYTLEMCGAWFFPLLLRSCASKMDSCSGCDSWLNKIYQLLLQINSCNLCRLWIKQFMYRLQIYI